MIARGVALLIAGGVVTAAAVWSARDESTAAPPTPAAATASGVDLFAAKGCAVCHTGPDSTSNFVVGPSLHDAASWAATRVDGLSAEQYVTQSILDPSAVISPAAGGNGARMPAIAMAPGEVDALVTYLLATR